MKTVKKLLLLLFISLSLAVAMGAGASTQSSEKVGRGFYFGPPAAQQKVEYSGYFSVSRRGFPATYREVQRFQATDGATYEVSYVSKPFSLLLLIANVVLLMSFLVAVLSPITIFWRPQRKPVEVKPTEKKTESQVKQAHADTRD